MKAPDPIIHPMPSAPPLAPMPPDLPPPAYPGGYSSVEPKRHKFCCNFVDARKGAFALSVMSVMFSFVFLFILFLEGVVLLVVAIVSILAFYRKNHILYMPQICFVLLNCFLTLVVTVGAVVAIFAPELASAYIPYLPDIIKEWYRYFAFACATFCLCIFGFCLWVLDVYIKAYKSTRDIAKYRAANDNAA